jgi:hypothetical protein
VWLLREDVLECLGCFYLAQYPAVGRLLRTARFFPSRFLDFIETFTKRMQDKVITGPFCSELVMTSLRATRAFLSSEDGQRGPETFSPSDLEHLKGWEASTEGFLVAGAENLPGTESVDTAFSNGLLSLLSLPWYINQAFASRIRLIESSVTEIIAALTARQYLDGLVPESISSVPDVGKRHLEILRHIHRYINAVCDPLWNWIKEANECSSDCPVNRHRAGHKVRLNEPTLSERVSLPTYKVVEHWDGLRCPDIRSCPFATSRWHHLNENARLLSEEIRQELQSAP